MIPFLRVNLQLHIPILIYCQSRHLRIWPYRVIWVRQNSHLAGRQATQCTFKRSFCTAFFFFFFFFTETTFRHTLVSLFGYQMGIPPSSILLCLIYPKLIKKIRKNFQFWAEFLFLGIENSYLPTFYPSYYLMPWIRSLKCSFKKLTTD